jgi:RNA polymerase sigma-70 factor, ECF subfamily
MIWDSIKLLLAPNTMNSTVPAIGEVTALLERWSAADSAAREHLMTIIYPELRRIAQSRMRRERSDHTLQPTALVNEVFLQLVDCRRVTWRNRAHFLAVASRAMRRILVDHARARGAARRSAPGGPLVSIGGLDAGRADDAFDLVEIEELLVRLAEQDPRMAQVAELRIFAGLTYREVAEVIGVHSKTISRDWDMARAWLLTQIRPKDSDDRPGLGSA